MQRRILVVATLAASLAAAVPLSAATAASKKPARGVVYGAVTKPGYPVLIELSKGGRKVVTAAIGLELACQIPPNITLPDDFSNLKISKSGRFSAKVPVTRSPADPSANQPAIDISASMTGRVSKDRRSIKGTWRRTVVIYDSTDPTGVAVEDTCDTGVVRFSAKQ
jgi:hypothetical protein